MTLFSTRPRRAAVALFALAASFGGLNAVVSSANAEEPCTRARVWTYSNEGRTDRWNDCVGPAPWEPNTQITVVVEQHVGPDNTPVGGGFEVWTVP